MNSICGAMPLMLLNFVWSDKLYCFCNTTVMQRQLSCLKQKGRICCSINRYQWSQLLFVRSSWGLNPVLHHTPTLRHWRHKWRDYWKILMETARAFINEFSERFRRVLKVKRNHIELYFLVLCRKNCMPDIIIFQELWDFLFY